MRRKIYWCLVGLICISALGCAFISGALISGSGFIFGDIDYTEAQQQVAQSNAAIFSGVCLIACCASLAVLFLSRRIANFIFKIFGSTELAGS